MEIASTPVKYNEVVGLGQNARRYFYTQTGETICFVSLANNQIMLYSAKMIPLQAISFILTDHQKYF